ncbi:MAG: hypothetical protein AAF433_06065 [Bacteroidota bacterium]
MYRYIFLFAGLWIAVSLGGQTVLVTDLSPTFGPISLEQLSQQSVTNLSERNLEGQLFVSLLDEQQQLVVELSSFLMQLAPGQFLSNTSIPWSRRPIYGTSPFSQSLAQLGLLTTGNFVRCYEFRTADGSVLAQSCQEKSTGGTTNFSLLYPFDRSTIAEERPLLTWEAWTSAGVNLPDLSYELVLVEMEAGQSPAAALERNVPLLRRSGLRDNQLLYPNGMASLKKGVDYAWAVQAQIRGNRLADAGVWSFRLAETASPAEVQNPTNYAMLDTRLSSRFYWFEESINIGFDNNEGITELDYRIVDLHKPLEPLLKVPPINELQPGLNTLQIPIKELGLKPDQLYQLEVKVPRGQIYYLRFQIR